jgi:hypothetical protein
MDGPQVEAATDRGKIECVPHRWYACPYPQYVEALITGNFTGSGEAIKAAIARNSWA